MMPFSFSITEGIALGFISYCVMKMVPAPARPQPVRVVVAVLFVLKIVFIDAK
jgi:AGZA family xanthine/uracil permease-like MFS transporter